MKPICTTLPLKPLLKLRVLKATITSDEFHMHIWGSRHCKVSGPALPLADYLKEALREKLSSIVRDEIGRGNDIPPNVAHYLSQKPISGGGGKLS